MAYGANELDKSCTKLIKEVPKLSQPLKELLPNLQAVTQGESTQEEREQVTRVLAIGFFTTQAAKCVPLIAECVKALSKLPPVTPPSSKIQRRWIEDINTKLRKLQSQTYPQLETNVSTFYTVPEVASKISALTSIVTKLPGLIADFLIMSKNLEKTKRALRK